MIPQLALVSQFFGSQPVKRAYLFGSQARGDATLESDVDILVELESGVSIFEFAAMKIALEKLISKQVDLISIEGLPVYVKPFIERDKILIYEK